MNGAGILLILLIVGLPAAWLVAEFKASRSTRIVIGVLAFGAAIAFSYGLASFLTTINQNAWFGGATKGLIETSIAQVEDGHLDRVLKAWRALDAQYRPTYENRAGYKELVEGATKAMKGDKAVVVGSSWDAQPFDSETWIGHWENDTGFWIVINDTGRPFDVTRSGNNPSPLHSVVVTEDHRVLKFKEGDDWLHTLTLKNKHAAAHEWFDLRNQKIWATETLHKLRRADEAEKNATQQNDATQPQVSP